MSQQRERQPSARFPLFLCFLGLLLFFPSCSGQHSLSHPSRSAGETTPPPLREVAASWRALLPIEAIEEAFDTSRLLPMIQRAIHYRLQNQGIHPSAGSTCDTIYLLATQVAHHWLDAIEAHQQLKLAQQALAAYQETIRLIRSGYRRGDIPLVGLKQAKGILLDARQLVALRKRQEEEARRKLSLLMDDDGPALQLPETLPQEPNAIPPYLPASLLRRRPALKEAERHLSQTVGSSVANAVNGWLSQLQLTDGQGLCSSELRQLLNRDYLFLSLTSNLSLSPHPGSENDLQIASALEHYVDILAKILRQVAKKLSEAGQLAAQERTLKIRIQQTGETLRHAERGSASGLSDPVLRMEKERQWFGARSALLRVHNLRLRNRIELLGALGGGFRDGSALQNSPSVHPRPATPVGRPPISAAKEANAQEVRRSGKTSAPFPSPADGGRPSMKRR